MGWPHEPSGYPNTQEDAKSAGGAKMGDPQDMAWMASRLREQGCEILALKDEIGRLRKLVKKAYMEGHVDGLASSSKVWDSKADWEASVSKADLGP